jgi:hypothetical protein
MSIFDRFGSIRRSGELETAGTAEETAAAAGVARFGAVRPATGGTVFVELGDAVQKAQIARDGVGVPQVRIDPDVLAGLLAGRPKVVTKVVSQSVAPGTSVPKGTQVDVVLAEPFRLPAGVIRDIHVGLAQKTVGEVFDTFIRNNAAVRNVIARHDTADTLTDAERGVIQSAFSAQNVPITDQPGQTLNQAFSSLQGAFAFGSS